MFSYFHGIFHEINHLFLVPHHVRKTPGPTASYESADGWCQAPQTGAVRKPERIWEEPGDLGLWPWREVPPIFGLHMAALGYKTNHFNAFYGKI